MVDTGRAARSHRQRARVRSADLRRFRAEIDQSPRGDAGRIAGAPAHRMPYGRARHGADPVNRPTENADADRPIRIFIIDDHPTVAWGLEQLIESEAPHMVAVGKAGGSAEAL